MSPLWNSVESIRGFWVWPVQEPFRIDVSDAILDELVSVLRDDFKWDGYRLHFAREQIVKMANRVVPTQTIEAVKEDPDDNRVLECAVAAGSSVIVTYDRDLPRLGE